MNQSNTSVDSNVIPFNTNSTIVAQSPDSDFKVLSGGQAFSSQRKVAELCGVSQQAIQKKLSKNHDVSQGVNPDLFQKVVTYYAVKKGHPEAIETLSMLAEAGAKAYIMHMAGYVMEAKVTPQFNIPTNMIEAMELATSQMKLAETLKLENTKVTNDLIQLETITDEILNSDELYLPTAAAKLMSIPPRSFTKWMKQSIHFYYKAGKVHPKQTLINKGLVEVKYNRSGAFTNMQVYITDKGLIQLRKYYNRGV